MDQVKQILQKTPQYTKKDPGPNVPNKYTFWDWSNGEPKIKSPLPKFIYKAAPVSLLHKILKQGVYGHFTSFEPAAISWGMVMAENNEDMIILKVSTRGLNREYYDIGDCANAEGELQYTKKIQPNKIKVIWYIPEYNDD